jgi:ankyrin repeat protein
LCNQESKQTLQIIGLLVTAGANVNDACPYSHLQWAASVGKLKSVRLLLELGADLNFVSKDGTALHITVLDGQTKAAQLLLEQGANLTIKTPPDSEHPNLTAADLAKKLKRNRILKLIVEKSSANT